MAQYLHDNFDNPPWTLLADITALITPQEARYFNSRPTISEISELINRANAAAGTSVGRSKYAYGTRIKSFALTMARFAVMAPPEHEEAIWGTTKLVTTRALSSTEYLKKIVEILEELGSGHEETDTVLHRFPASIKIQRIVCYYHLVLLEICHDLLRILSEKDSKTLKTLWKKLKTDLEKNKKGLDSFKIYLDAEAHLISGDFNDRERQRIALYRQEPVLYYLDSVSKNWKTVLDSSKSDPNLQAKVVNSLCTRISGYDHEASLQRYAQGGSSRAMDFITGLPAFLDRTKHGSKKPLLWLYGSAGCGKSSLSVYLIKMLQSVSGENVFYFFCTPEIPESMQLETLFRSLLSQLLRTTDHIRHIYYNFEYPLNIEEIAAIIKTIINFRQQWVRHGDNRMYIVIDGTDNLSPAAEDELIKKFEKWCWQIQLKVILTNKKGPPAHRPGVLLDGIGQLETDVVVHIENELNMNLVSGLFNFDNKFDLIPIIKAAITDRARGNFLLATLHLSLVRYAKNEDNLLSLLETLPIDIIPTYNLILNTIKSQGDKIQAKRIFNIVGIAARPLTLEELSDYLEWNVETGDDLPAYSPTSVLDVCRGLVIAREVQGKTCIYFVHSSLKQYLMENRILDETRAHLEVGRGCIYYLHQTKFQLMDQEEDMTKDEKIEKAYHSIRKNKKNLKNSDYQEIDFSESDDLDDFSDISTIVSTLRISPPPTDIETLRDLITDSNQQTTIIERLSPKNRFLAYAKEHWLYHTRAMHKSDPAWGDFSSLVIEKRKLLFDIIPWVRTSAGAPITVASRKQYRMLANDWANQMKHYALSRLVVDWATIASERRSKRARAPL
ncbi:hypothetical protein AOL_s00076g434 [Orbilia oligospora ATCC 24927]|uniref:Uncharacterized protein n=1 Tax=Arthrobotrys oligospora (strain ATCC 24927 / CBS 115.81 / DSM 1491) TaxID=756982 RepID=G1X9U5_ARTOA|nr:hypothetical protein AOL_s00076g434 [Orbilia oligospora ATCC 24927]EGX50083.1 hypothetical protein AOL_s00076g434 [Orbilia oligospora ATCC 24927]